MFESAAIDFDARTFRSAGWGDAQDFWRTLRRGENREQAGCGEIERA